VQDDRLAQPVDAEAPPRLAFPVVGIGASAGGLPAVTEFLTAMRADSGMAFVFIQHLSPDRESMMAEILGTKTAMRVQQVEDGMAIEANNVYVIRPGHILTIRNGRFHLGEQVGRRGTTRPVDDFFKSLAEEQRERAIAIVMSGMGSNGTAGAQAIKAVGGLCIAQEPESAEFPSMPRHLIDQGYADYILRPVDMPEVLLHYAQHPYASEGRQDNEDQLRHQYHHLREILAILRTRTRQDFVGYKKPTILRRIQRRMGLTQLTDMADYARLMRHSPTEASALADDLLIHVTGFFRDPEAWEAMRQRVIVPLVARREAESEVRAWVTACASGEEAYTLAILLAEESERANKPLGIKVFATDMADRALTHARLGIYPGGIESEIDPQRLEKFFDREDAVYRIKPFLRECVMFAPQNVLSDPPFSRLDIVTCRNMLIYLEPEMQRRVLSLLHFGLREGGALFLGSSESVGVVDDMYEVVDKRARIFRRVGPTRHGLFDFPVPHAALGGLVGTTEADASLVTRADPIRAIDPRTGRAPGRPSLGLLTQRTLLEQHVQAAITIDRDNRVLYYHGNTRPFLEQPQGEPTRDLMMLCREGMRGSVRVALHRCAAEQKAVTVLDGWVETTPGRQARVAVTASSVSMNDPAHPEYFVVSFDQLEEPQRSAESKADRGGEDDDDATSELHRMRDELQTTIEELQTSNEELKASHEEVTSINEELQSSNEELETSKEEMQSLNEELTTLNAQLTAKMEEHQEASNDISALLSSTAIAVLFLDAELRIRRFTPALRGLMDLIPGDIGRPLKNMNRKFDDPTLDEDVRVVLDKLVPVEREVSAENQHVYARRVLPYRTVDNRIDGVVITFFDITDRKRIEAEAAQAREYAESIVETTHEPLLVLQPDLTVRSANEAFYRQFKVTEAETVGRKIYKLGNGQWNIPSLRTALEEVLPMRKVFEDYKVEHTFVDLGRRVMLVNGRQLDHVQLILLGIRDVTTQDAAESALRDNEERLHRMVSVPGVGILSFDDKGTLIDANDAFLEMSGYTREQVKAGELSWRRMTPAEHIAESEQQFEQLKQTGRIGPYEKEYFRADGTRALLMFAGTSVGDGTVIKYCIDLSGYKGERSLVRETEERFRMIVDNIKEYAIFMVDPDGIITSWNPGAQLVFGYTEEEILGHPAGDLFTPEDRAAGEDAKELETARRDGRASDDRWQMRKGGERFWATGVTTVMRDATGALTGFLKICRDDTPRKETEQALQTAKATAEAANRAKDEFLATVSHELRTPLSAILLWSRILQPGDESVSPTPEQLAEGLSAIHTSAQAQIELIQDLLDISRVQTGTLRLQIRRVELVPLVREALDALAPAAAAKDIRIETDLQDIGATQLDPSRFRQIIWNLLQNAVKFTSRGGRVSVTLRRNGGSVEFVVTDTGRGISAEFLPYVFERFRQAHSGQGGIKAGLGLGLAIVRELVELHGGQVTVHSEGEGKGATFTVTLPIVESKQERIAAPVAPTPLPAATSIAGRSILLVEDDLSTRRVLEVTLVRAGARVTAVDSVPSAMQAIEKESFDVVISDIGLPEEDGYAFVRRLRVWEKSNAKRPLPAIALTAFARPEDRRRALDAGFSLFAVKPADADWLLTAVAKLAE
jgi:PAS domain S-box-containing protein